MLQNFNRIISVLGVLCISKFAFADSTTIDKYLRDGSSVNLLQGSKVNDMPYGYYIPKFSKSSIKAFSQQDFSAYGDKKIFIGYGTYDINDENCRYLDIPENKTLPIAFEKIYSTSNETYAISRDKMTYASCLAKTGGYSGYIFAPSSTIEAGNIYRNFGLDKDVWIGYSRNNCGSAYLNTEGNEQNYENFLNPIEICDENKRFAYKIANDLHWDRVAQSELHYCPIKIASNDYLRPIKVCLPWWRVERQWKLEGSDDRFEYDGQSYDFSYARYLMDYPMEKTICTQINNNPLAISSNFKSSIRVKTLDENKQVIFKTVDVSCVASNPNIISEYDYGVQFSASCSLPSSSQSYNYTDITFECTNTDSNDSISTANCIQKAPSFEVTCQSYDDIKKSPICISDISDPICHVDECKGYIKDACVKTSTIAQQKEYDYGYILVDNVETKVKVRQNKQISSYQCPPPNKSNDHCLAKSVVNVFPKHCPNPATGQPSQCDELSNCLRNKENTLEQCKASFYCEKNYGSADNILYDANGVAYALGGVCKDGATQIEALIEIKDNIKRTCLSYNEVNSTMESIKSCLSEATPSNYTLSSSITEDDIYKDNNNCVRTNNIEEARPTVQTVFDYTTKGFFKTAIQKAYIDNTETTHDSNASTEYVLAASSLKLEPMDFNVPTETPTLATTYTPEEQFCKDTFSDAFMGRFLTESESEPYPALMGILDEKVSGGNLEKCRTTATLLNDRCQYNIAACGSYTYDNTNDVCRDAGGNIKPFNCADYSLRDKNICYEEKWYKYPLIAISSDKGTCDSYTSSLGFLKNTNGNVFYEDYNFEAIGITQSQINSKSFCIMGGNPIKGDEQFSVIKKSLDNVYYTTSNSITKSSCEAIANCFSGDIISDYSSISSQQCTILANDETDTEQIDINVSLPNPLTVPLTEASGTFIGDINGYSDVFGIQEYTDGEFGYASNYIFRLPQNNIVLLDGKEISPIIEQSPITYKIKYDYSQAQHNQITKNRTPDNHAGSASGFFPTMHTYVGDNRVFGSTFLSNITEWAMYPVMIFGSKQKWGWYDSFYNLYQPVEATTKYYPNLYGYDPRFYDTTTATLVWTKQDIHSGTMKEGAYTAFRNSDIQAKKDTFSIYGFSDDTINTLLISSNEKNAIGWPGIKWYQSSAKKTNTSSASGTTYPTKPINTIFMGAVNSLSIVVPYKGEYEVRAFDKYNNLLATKKVEEQNFIKGAPSTTGNIAHTYAKVQMATANDFNIAPGQNRNLNDGGCISSNFVEWGGGVSGAYYEQGVPDIGMGSDCFKSNDNYVLDHSAVRVTINAVNSPIVFNVRLKKPMPFPNRIVLVNLDNEETRKYQCWTSTEKCDVSNATEITK